RTRRDFVLSISCRLILFCSFSTQSPPIRKKVGNGGGRKRWCTIENTHLHLRFLLGQSRCSISRKLPRYWGSKARPSWEKCYHYSGCKGRQSICRSGMCSAPFRSRGHSTLINS